MALDDFDLPGLADYLHLNQAQVQRLVDRGQLPGRKVGGQWRFSRSEIHHWLEDRIGGSGEVELAQVETALKRSHGAHHEPLTLAELIPPGGVAWPLSGRTRNSIIAEMSELAAATGLLWDAAAMAEAIRQRENLHSTALDIGVALLHPRRPLANILAEPLLTLGRSNQGIPFGGRALTDVFFLIASVDDAGHLRTLARLSRVLAAPDFLPALRDAVDEHEVRRLIADTEPRFD